MLADPPIIVTLKVADWY